MEGISSVQAALLWLGVMSNRAMYIVAADALIDATGDLTASKAARDKLDAANCRITHFEISSSADGWQSALPPNRLRCACSPMTAINRAKELFATGEADAIVIHGRDYLKSDYRNRKAKRNRLMEIYGEGKGQILDGYDELAGEFLKFWGIGLAEFHQTAEAIFENHLRVWKTAHPNGPFPGPEWYEPISKHFRGVDCANPSVDFEGCLVVADAGAVKKCGFDKGALVRITGCAVEQACEDSLETIPQIVPYDHLARAYRDACREAGADFSDLFLANRALLEVYTCYPVVPMGFLLSSGMVADFSEIAEFANRHALTVTGGLNLAKAPWNNTTLQAFAAMNASLLSDDAPRYGGIHSVGALGYLQAFAVLERTDSSMIRAA